MTVTLFKRLTASVVFAALVVAMLFVFQGQPDAQAEMSVSQAKAQVTAAENQLQASRSRYERAKQDRESKLATANAKNKTMQNAKAAVSSAQSSLAAAKRKQGPAQQAVRSTQAAANKARGANAKAQDKKNTSQQEYDIAVAALANGKESAKKAADAVSAATSSLEDAVEQVRYWKAQVKEAKQQKMSKQKIKQRQQRVDDWIEKRDDKARTLEAAKQDLQIANDAVTELEKQKADKQTALTQAKDAALATAAALNQANSKLYSAKNKLRSISSTVSKLTGAVQSKQRTYNASVVSYNDAVGAYRGSESAYNSAVDQVNTAISALTKAKSALSAAQKAATNTSTSGPSPSTSAPTKSPASPQPTSNPSAASTDQWLETFAAEQVAEENKNNNKPELEKEEPVEVIDDATPPAELQTPEPVLPGPAESEDNTVGAETEPLAADDTRQSPKGLNPLLMVALVLLGAGAIAAWQLKPMFAGGPKPVMPKTAKKLGKKTKEDTLLHQDNQDSPYNPMAAGATSEVTDASSPFAAATWGSATGSSVLDRPDIAQGSAFVGEASPGSVFGAPAPTPAEYKVTVLVRDSERQILLVHNGTTWGPLSTQASTGGDPITDAANVLAAVTGWPVPDASALNAEVLFVDGFSSVVQITLEGTGYETSAGTWGTVAQVHEACASEPWVAFVQ